MYTTGDMARLSNNTLRTVRFYEEAGILQPVRRTDGGHRLFEREQLDKLMLVSDMREAGMSLEEIRTLLETKQRATSPGAAAREAVATLKRHVGDLRTKVEVLGRLAEDLSSTIEAAGVCAECKHPESFPAGCNDCENLQSRGPMPRGMRVLWNLHAKAADGHAADEAHAPHSDGAGGDGGPARGDG
ncbi:MAG: MerR family transcriptional regulator [Polyangiaceae bacterium]